ncbi:MAG: hypothetical protein NT003_02725, partial [Candidatus Magasanikbacteria bacterium]|nr:hypothetical protein [Candidatus Magasanikbacteria bacterium]
MGGPGNSQKVVRATRRRSTDDVLKYLRNRAVTGFELSDLWGASSRPFSCRSEANEWWEWARVNETIVSPPQIRGCVFSNTQLERHIHDAEAPASLREMKQSLCVVRDVQPAPAASTKQESRSVPADYRLLILYLELKRGDLFEFPDVERYFATKLPGMDRFPWTGRDYAMRRLEVLTNDGYLNSDHDHTTWEVLYFDERWRVEHEPAPPPVVAPKPTLVPKPQQGVVVVPRPKPAVVLKPEWNG